MQLHCLGTAGYHPNESRHTSCYFLPDCGVVLDAGTGMFRLPQLIRGDSLDILLSHSHLDHVAGLTFLLDILFQRPVDKLRIWGERKKLDAIRTHLFSELVFPVQLQTQWCEIDDRSEFEIGPCRVTWRRQEHPGGSVGYRLDWGDGPRLLYLSDTTGDDSDEAVAWSEGADLMMHECYFRAEHQKWAVKTGHTWTGRVAEIARATSPARLLLTHVNPLESRPGELMREVCEGLSSQSTESRLTSFDDSVAAQMDGSSEQAWWSEVESGLRVALANDGTCVQFGEAGRA